MENHCNTNNNHWWIQKFSVQICQKNTIKPFIVSTDITTQVNKSTTHKQCRLTLLLNYLNYNKPYSIMPLSMCVEFGYYISMCNIYVDQNAISFVVCYTKIH